MRKKPVAICVNLALTTMALDAARIREEHETRSLHQVFSPTGRLLDTPRPEHHSVPGRTTFYRSKKDYAKW